ncbi:MAG TPA: hypothetical protein VJN88_10585 [Ktedonobacterales bacterium]|nr:hypothetical protein [Ktedonobacterales bacterium]
MIGAVVNYMICMIQSLLKDYVERAEKNGLQSAELAWYKHRHEEFMRIASSVLSAAGATPGDELTTALGRAFEIFESIVQRSFEFKQEQARDFLYELSLRPDYAATAGSALYAAVGDMRGESATQLQWLASRFHRPLLNQVLRQPYRHVGPADVDVQLAGLLSVVQQTYKAAEYAVRQLDLAHHSLNLLLPKPTASAPLPSPWDSHSAASVEVQMSSTPSVMATLRTDHFATVAFLGEQSANTQASLGVATKPGGGIDAQVVRTNSVKTLRYCLLAAQRVESQRKYIADLASGTVDAVKPTTKS